MMKIKFYGATWCPDCNRAKQVLDDRQVEYEYINLEENPDAADEVVRINNGYQSIPTIVFPSGKVLIEPSNEQLTQALSDM
jgi:mycoredoxin